MSASRQRTRRRFVTDHDRFTLFLLEDHTVPQLANSLVPVHSSGNVLPLSRRLHVRHRVLASLPSRLTQSTMLALRGAANEGAERMSDKEKGQSSQGALVQCTYPSYHQLHCPKCQTQARRDIDDAVRNMVLVEAQQRDTTAAEEQSKRESLYQRMKQERRLLTVRQGHNDSSETAVTVGLVSSPIPDDDVIDVIDELQRVEHDARVTLTRSLWRKLRVVQCAAREWMVLLHHQQRTPVSSSGPAVPTASLESSVAACLRRADELAVRAAEVARTQQAAWAAAQRELCAREVECRLVIEDEYMTSAACTLTIAAVDWKVSANRSLEERVKSEKAGERSRIAAAEKQGRALLLSVEEASRKTIVAQFADAHREYAKRLFGASMSTLVTKETRARADRIALFLSERETLMVRAATLEQKELRHSLEREETRGRTDAQDEHNRWLAERTDEDVLLCQLASATTLADRAIAAAQRLVVAEVES